MPNDEMKAIFTKHLFNIALWSLMCFLSSPQCIILSVYLPLLQLFKSVYLSKSTICSSTVFPIHPHPQTDATYGKAWENEQVKCILFSQSPLCSNVDGVFLKYIIYIII